MALTTSSNILSLSGQRALLSNLTKAQLDYTRAAERVATGLRINRASDDPSGNALVGRFTAQINGIEQATRNVEHAISFMDTADSDMTTIETILQDIRTRIVETATGVSDDVRLQNQAEIAPLLLELERMAQSSEFDGRKLFNTASQNFVYQVGPNAADLVSIQTSDLRINQIGVYRLEGALPSGGASARNGVKEKLTINGAVGSRSLNIAIGTSANITAQQVNGVKQFTGVEALARTEADISGWVAGTYRMTLAADNSVPVSVDVPVEQITGPTALSFDDAIAAINAFTTQTGVVASLNEAALLAQSTGVADAAAGITLTNDKGNNILIGQPIDTTTGVGATGFANPGTELKIAGSVAGVALTSNTTTLKNSDALTRAITGQTTFIADRPFQVISTQPDNPTSTNYPTAGLTLKKPASGGFVSEASSLVPLSQLDVTTLDKAKLALFAVDNAIDGLNRQRASIGSTRGRFEDYILPNLEMDDSNLLIARGNISELDPTEMAIEDLNKQFAVDRYTLTLTLLSEASELQKTVLALLG